MKLIIWIAVKNIIIHVIQLKLINANGIEQKKRQE